MIILKCSRCQKQLEVDDAFASGVCRCVHCGALSQVPAQPTRLDQKGRPLVPPPMAQPVIAPPEAQQQFNIAPSRAYAASRRRMGLLAVIMMLAALAMAVLVVLLARDAFTPQEQPATAPVPPTHDPALDNPFVQADIGPSFVKLPLPTGNVAYLLNVGSSMRPVFDHATRAVELSVKHAGPRKFAVVPWAQGNAPDEAPAVFPQTDLAEAGQATLGQLDSWFREFSTHDAREPALAAAEAVKRGAAVLVLITRNDLDKEVVDGMLAQTKGQNVTWLAAAIDTVAGDAASYTQLVRLTGDVGRVTAAPISLLDVWLEEMGGD